MNKHKSNMPEMTMLMTARSLVVVIPFRRAVAHGEDFRSALVIEDALDMHPTLKDAEPSRRSKLQAPNSRHQGEQI